jgi:hypothetical protein
MPLYKFRTTVIRNKSERVNPETIHMPIRPDDTVSSHCPKKGMQSARLLTEEIPRRVMRSCCLGNLAVRLWLHGVDEVCEQNGILDKKHWDIVPNNI